MTGRAIIILVAGIIVIAGLIMHRIEANGSRIAENYTGYYERQRTQNLAQSGANLALRQLAFNRYWHAGIGTSVIPLSTLGGKVYVTVDTGVLFRGINTIRITSVSKSEFTTISDTTLLKPTYTSTVYAYFPPATMPTGIKGLITLNSSNAANGNFNVDARDHNAFSTAVIPGKGTYAVWTTGSSFNQGGSSTYGGTVGGVDHAPKNPADSGVVLVNQITAPSFSTTPDSIFGGASAGYPDGTLKAIARTGLAGSQYVTDPSKLKKPLSGVTYVELPAGGTWGSADLGTNATGIIIVHNVTRDATIKDAGGTFSGILVADNIDKLHCNIWGAIVALTTAPSGNVIGNSGANMYYSNQSITNATSVLTNGSQPKIAGWYE